ncbi:Uncharacterised protein [Vibrio cholerae]|nr:Uncharacterised protein [Vibrio cholerae]CSI66960.1 Uncharacterised protein [Vibrio cholerae]
MTIKPVAKPSAVIQDLSSTVTETTRLLIGRPVVGSMICE